MSTNIAWIGLGSNLDSPMQQVLTAFEELNSIPNSTVLSTSSLYESEPFGPVEQNNFVNAVACIRTSLSPHDLLSHLQSIEQHHKREREIHWGPRTLDLDILLFGDQQIKTDRLIVPHPYLSERNFVLYPLLELVPNLTLPTGQTLKELTNSCAKGNLKRISI